MSAPLSSIQGSAFAALLLCAAANAAEPPPIPVAVLASEPKVDGDIAEWGKAGWQKIAVTPTVKADERAKLGLASEDRNATGSISVELKAGVANGRIYMAMRWPDSAADTDVDVWSWNGTRYSRSPRYDDMFAVRFAMAGDYDRSMLSGKNYEADVWLWSAARSDPAGIAEDYRHVISTKLIENAAEYSVKDVGTVYIKKYRDEGEPPYKTRRPPKTKEAEQLPAIEMVGPASGSLADVSAKGVWKNGFWTLEMSRALDTGRPDDVALPRGGRIRGQIAVFNHANDEHKSVSDPLNFDLSAVK